MKCCKCRKTEWKQGCICDCHLEFMDKIYGPRPGWNMATFRNEAKRSNGRKLIWGDLSCKS